MAKVTYKSNTYLDKNQKEQNLVSIYKSIKKVTIHKHVQTIAADPTYPT